MIKIKNNKTDEELTFSDDWEVIKEKKEAKIHGEAFVKLFKHWVEVNQSAFAPSRLKPVYRYDKDKDMLFYIEADSAERRENERRQEEKNNHLRPMYGSTSMTLITNADAHGGSMDMRSRLKNQKTASEGQG